MSRTDAFNGGRGQVPARDHGFDVRDAIPPFERYRKASAPKVHQLPLDTPLMTDQTTLTSRKLEALKDTRVTADHPAPVKVWAYGKDTWVEDGHHRIAAARARGDSHIEVVHRRATGDLYADKKLPKR